MKTGEFEIITNSAVMTISVTRFDFAGYSDQLIAVFDEWQKYWTSWIVLLWATIPPQCS